MKINCFSGLMLALALISSQVLADSRQWAGTWYGQIDLPDGEMLIIVALNPEESGWDGSMDIPAQGAQGIPLQAIQVDGDRVSFGMAGVPGEPRFTGQLHQGEDGKPQVTGTFAQSGHNFAFKLGREPLSLPYVHTAEEAAAVIDGHLAAYNAHDLDDFVSHFHPEIEAFNFPDKKVFEGIDALRSGFAQTFQSKPQEIVLNRIIDGNHVIDQVEVSFTIQGSEMTQRGTVIYTLEDHKIRRMTYMR